MLKQLYLQPKRQNGLFVNPTQNDPYDRLPIQASAIVEDTAIHQSLCLQKLKMAAISSH